MVTVKRQKKRSTTNQSGKYIMLGGAALAIIILIMAIVGWVGRAGLQAQMDDLSEYMAKSIRTDLNQVIQCYGTLDKKSDSAAEVLPNMKKYMYSAYNMNKILVESRGSKYSIIDVASYNSFQTIVGEYERLLANGQATSTVKASLGDYISSLEDTVLTRFDSADLLLPQQALR